MKTSEPKADLVLVGGGHAHVLALRKISMRRPQGLRITLVSESEFTPYSGMLPGLVAGHYGYEDTHIDLARFCKSLGVRFVRAEACGLNISDQTLLLKARPSLGFDLLSINLGSQPNTAAVPGAAEYALPVKPVAHFYRHWQKLEQDLQRAAGDSVRRLVIVGGGAGSIELALAIAHRLPAGSATLELVCGSLLLESYNAVARRSVRRALAACDITVTEQCKVQRVEPQHLIVGQGTSIAYDHLIWCTAAAPPDWLGSTELPRDERGFLLTEDTLQVLGFENIFAVGDVAVQMRHPRPRAGVYAVRQGPVLAENLVREYQKQPLREHRPQQRFLSLLSLGEKRAVADKAWFFASGSWIWRWKDAIDRKFMRLFTDIPQMIVTEEQGDTMHCGGCGAKLPAGMLREALQALALDFPSVVDEADFGDDAAVLETAPGHVLVQSVDSLRELVDDPWLMGRIAALHALSDIHAMGARPHSCLTSISLPYGAASAQSRDLQQLMCGAMWEMAQVGCRLLGGHSIEGPELTIGFTVNGEIEQGKLLAKTGARPGAKLVLTKALGTGVLFAAHAEGGADGRDIQAAIETMLLSNAAAAEIALHQGVQACTDVTGFGLLGHLLEMLQGTVGMRAKVSLGQISLLSGVSKCFDAGFRSTLYPGNRAAVASRVELADEVDLEMTLPLYDPQTSGGLLLAVSAKNLEDVLSSLKLAGYDQASCIGELQSAARDLPVLIAP